MAGKQKYKPMPLLAIILAWLVPGAGHAYLGRTVRGLIIFVTIMATFWAGIAMGGVLTLDSENERWWFMADMITGISGLYCWQMERQEEAKYNPPGDPAAKAVYLEREFARKKIALVEPTAVIARAFAGIAGLLNLMCIFDAVILAMIGKTGEPQVQAEESSPKGKEGQE